MDRQVMLNLLLMAVSGLVACGWHPDSPLVDAIDRGSMDEVRQLAATSNAFDRSEALIWAARQGYTRALDVLLDAGVDPNERGGANGWTPLMHAVHKGQLHSVERLLAHGANTSAGDPSGFTPLMMAAGYGYTEMVKVLLAAGANPRLESRTGITALSAAIGGASDIDRWTAGSCQTDTVKLLLDKFPDLRLPDNTDSRRSVWIARHVGRCATIADLLKNRS